MNECAAADRVVRLASGGLMAADDEAAEPDGAGHDESSPAHRAGTLRVTIDPPSAGADGPVVRVTEPLVLELRAGAPVALVGPNGAGKTVALEAIAGVRPIPQVRVSGSGDGPGPVLAAQHPDLQVFGSTVAEELAWAAGERGGDPGLALRSATELLVELSLERSVLDRSTWSLSAGERRIVQIVSALVTPASAVLVDEPTCGLDPGRAARLGQVLGRFAQAIPVAIATQDRVLAGRIRASLRGLGVGARNPASTYGKTD